MTSTFRELGKTGIKVSTVTMGCWAIVGDATWGPQSEQDAINAIHAALDLGVNCFDSAEMYGNGYSEQILAKALVGKRNQVVLCSKFISQHANSWEDLSS
ncbi:MAG TPA: aldo/keto reductase, partial [Lentisphaeria bacterium]|nr:aldo/keto reductase [Lentisphaeria bacterium]